MSALSGIRVLDLSRVLAGPWCAQTLADLGAEVIKVEKPCGGDDTRAWGPPWFESSPGQGRESAYFLSANRNKKSIAVDFATQDGATLIRQLVKECDVLIENFKAGALARYGLDYASLSPLNPGLVYCSITGFGQQGPYSGRAGYDFLIQGMGGLMSITGVPDGQPGGGPQKVGVALTDILTGMYACTGILAAVLESKSSGLGQHIDVSLLDVQVACLANQAMNFLVSGQTPARLGNAHPNIVPYQDFTTLDGYMILAIGNDSQFSRFCKLIKKGEWAEDPLFRSNSDRIQNRAELIARLSEVLRTQTSHYWITLLDTAGVPCGPINSIEQVFADAQVVARGALVDIPTPEGGSVPSVANPLRLSRTAAEYRLPPPGLGANSREVLHSVLGLGHEEIDALIAKKTIAGA